MLGNNIEVVIVFYLIIIRKSLNRKVVGYSSENYLLLNWCIIRYDIKLRK